MFFKSPRVSASASLLSFSLSWRSVLKFHCVGTSLMRNFDLYCIQRWTFIFSDVCFTQCSPCESYSSNWSQNFRVLPRNRCRFWRLRVLWYTTHLSHRVRNSHCTFVITLFSAFCLVVPQPSSAEISTLRRKNNLEIHNPIVWTPSIMHMILSYHLSLTFCWASPQPQHV